MKSKVLVIFTGGTIGASTHEGVISVDSGKTYALINQFNSQSESEGIEFDIREELNILSENSRPPHWTIIAEAILRTDLSSYKGVVITHGTDTLAYASAALGFLLAEINIPVVLVSSDKPLDDESSNGLSNFTHAIRFIENQKCSGVFSVYRNPDGKSYLHLGTRLTSALPFIHSFRSEKDAFIGEFIENGFQFNRSVYEKINYPDIHQAKTVLKPIFSEKVLYIRPHPGLNYNHYNLEEKPDAVLHDLYHSGTACTQVDDENLSILNFAEKCAKHEIPFYVAPIPGEGDIYETCKELIEKGVIALHDMAVESALVKIMLAYGNADTISDKASFVQSNEIANEFIKLG